MATPTRWWPSIARACADRSAAAEALTHSVRLACRGSCAVGADPVAAAEARHHRWLAPGRQHAIQRQLRLEAGLLQPPGHLARHVAAAGEPVRAAGVVEQAAAATEYARELAVEHLRVELAGDAEARRVVQERVDRGVGHLRDRFGHVGMG